MREHKAPLLALCACAAGTPAPAAAMAMAPRPREVATCWRCCSASTSLRTAFREEQGEALQHIESAAVLPRQVTDLEALALAQLLEKARSQEAEAAQLPFALQRAPL